MSHARAVRIDLARARTIVDRAIAHARSNDFPPMTVAVLDTAARLVAFAGEDDSSLLRERIARGKAHGALNMGVGSRSLAARAASDPAFVNALVSLADGNLVPVPTASPPRGCALTPERLIQPDPAIPTNRLGDIS
jgi:uncharacterized protein GlcG (DUF336 family)